MTLRKNQLLSADLILLYSSDALPYCKFRCLQSNFNCLKTDNKMQIYTYIQMSRENDVLNLIDSASVKYVNESYQFCLEY